MNNFKNVFFLLVLFFVSACQAAQAEPTIEIEPTSSLIPTPVTAPARTCKPTLDDGVSPSYVPNTPERTVVGSGHVVTGVVLSSVDCQPISSAKLEFWPEEAGLGHPDTSRATFFTDENGRYRFECNLPEHIHMRISAPGFKTIGVNSYHPEGSAEGVVDIVLIPE
jgi:protocatechuate 3,4-dioxygenase beta subunit